LAEAFDKIKRKDKMKLFNFEQMEEKLKKMEKRGDGRAPAAI